MPKNIYERSPTLATVLMIEKIIKKHSGEYNKTGIWKKLPKKVMWQTYLVAINYLQSTNKIAYDRNGTVGYIWNPTLARIIRKRPELKM